MRRRQLLGNIEPILLIAIGGFAGANARYAVDVLIPGSLTSTFAVNVVGSFALGVLVYDSLRDDVIHDNSRLVFGTGFLSSFTTYSMFVLDAVTDPEIALLYISGSYVCGFGAVLLARGTVQWLEPTDETEADMEAS